MCGIFGLYSYRAPKTRRAALNTLLNGLRQLEYRGWVSTYSCSATLSALSPPAFAVLHKYLPVLAALLPATCCTRRSLQVPVLSLHPTPQV